MEKSHVANEERGETVVKQRLVDTYDKQAVAVLCDIAERLANRFDE
jgi:hypothetical protein